MDFDRRAFLKGAFGVAACGGLGLLAHDAAGAAGADDALPVGGAPPPVPLPHFPDRLHAFVFRNWTLVPVARMAEVLGATEKQVLDLGRSMGLGEPAPVTDDQWRRSYITVLRRNWHLLPYPQLLQLLGWTAAHMAFMLREDDFLYIKLGSHKPKCESLRYAPPDDAARKRAAEIAAVVQDELAKAPAEASEPLFAFVKALSEPLTQPVTQPARQPDDPVRFCYSYFALYGDPLLEPEADPFPDGLLQRLAALGVNGVWLQGVLAKLAPLPWMPDEDAAQRQTRLTNLRALAQRAAKHGVGVWLYLNEPRAMPVAFFERHPELKGITKGADATVCISVPQVRAALTDAVAHVCRNVPELAGFFAVTASENVTNCWSHGLGANCPRCGKRGPAEVIAEVNALVASGIRAAGSDARLIAWDWGWKDEWAQEAIARLPKGVRFQSVSEWSIPIRRGGVETVVGEYSISTIGPGPRATRRWRAAREAGLETVAKIQAGNTWELSAVPYIPAVENVARHVANLRKAGIDSLMLGWTLGGYPSPNLEVACAIARERAEGPVEQTVAATLAAVATRRFGAALAAAVVRTWQACSRAFSEYPYHGDLVYRAPMQFGPSNPLWPHPTGYPSTMIGFPYDDLAGWRTVYPPEVFVRLFAEMADGFSKAAEQLRRDAGEVAERQAAVELRRKLDVITAAAIHFRSTADQARFVMLRDALHKEKDAGKRRELASKLEAVLAAEIALARELYAIQRRDSRIGFEASNQYYYVPQDLVEKVVNCQYLLREWLPKLAAI